MKENSFLKLIRGYEHADGIGEKRFCNYSLSGTIKFKTNNKTVLMLSKFGDSLSSVASYTSTRGYGLFFLSFGLLSLIVHFIKDYFNFYTEVPLYILVLGTVFSVISIPLLAIDKPLFPALQSFRLTDYILFEFLCVKRMQNTENEHGVPPFVMLIAGLLLAVVGAFVPMWTVSLGIFAVIYLFFTFMSPEFSFFTMFLILPFISKSGAENTLYLSVIVIVTMLSLFRKVMVGKRVFAIEQYDLVIFALMIMYIASSLIFNRGVSIFEPIYMVVLALGYMLVGSLIANRRLADCVVNAIVISSIPVSIFVIYRFIVVLANGQTVGFTGVKEPFSSSSSLAAFLIVATIFSVYFIKISRVIGARIFYSVVFALSIISIALTYVPSAILALAVALIAYTVTKMKRMSGLVLALIALLPHAALVLMCILDNPISSIPILSYLGVGELISSVKSGWNMLFSNFFFGVGASDSNFITEYQKYGGVDAYTPNIFLQIACEFGIFALILFVALFVIRIIHRRNYRSYVKHSQVSTISSFTTTCIVSLIAYGAFNNIWSDMRIYYLFWCVFAVGSATLRIARREYDDRVDYYSDGRTQDSSSIDVAI